MMGVYVTIDGVDLICYEDGIIHKFDKHRNKWWIVKQTPFKDSNEYEQLRISLNGKIYRQSRILAHVYLGLDLDSDLQVDHIDRNSLNNSIDNLRIVTNLQNQWNRDVKGYSKIKNSFEARLSVNGYRYTKSFKKEEDAIKWRNMMKSAFQIIPYGARVGE